MRPDILDLHQFYNSKIGHRVSSGITKAISDILSDQKQIIGVGYAVPYLDGLNKKACAFMPASQGGESWSISGRQLAVIVDEHQLTLADNSVECVFLIHCLEFCEKPHTLLREAWRVLEDGGAIIVIVPNRLGLLARFENTPFGHGRPFSATQLISELRKSLFSPEQIDGTIYFPPSKNRALSFCYKHLERISKKFLSKFSGVLIATAYKRTYAVPTSMNRKPIFVKDAVLGGF